MSQWKRVSRQVPAGHTTGGESWGQKADKHAEVPQQPEESPTEFYETLCEVSGCMSLLTQSTRKPAHSQRGIRGRKLQISEGFAGVDATQLPPPSLP